jgi:hypothetical protein
LGNIILREFAHEGASRAMPGEWSEPISDSERSFGRCMTGEWMFSSALLRLPPSGPFWEAEEMDLWPESSRLDQALAWASRPLYQPQDSINDYAAYYSQVAEILDAPLLSYEAAADRARALGERRRDGALQSLSPYNFVGRLLVGTPSFDVSIYARRVNDIEGVRRAALAAVKFRERKVPAERVAEELKGAEYRNPYNDAPFDWDAEKSAIVSTGLELAARGRHLLRY